MDTNLYFFNNEKLPEPLSKTETYKLLKEMIQGNEKARNELIIHNIRLVIYEVKTKFNFIQYNKQDLVSSGLIGLMKAVSSFDINKNIDFATYATVCIDNEIRMFLRVSSKHQNIDSLDRELKFPEQGNKFTLADVIASELNLIDDYILKEDYQEIRLLLNNLPEREKEIIMMHYGFYEDKIYTQEEIAKHFKISQSYVSRITKKTLNKLKCKITSRKFTNNIQS